MFEFKNRDLKFGVPYHKECLQRRILQRVTIILFPSALVRQIGIDAYLQRRILVSERKFRTKPQEEQALSFLSSSY